MDMRTMCNGELQSGICLEKFFEFMNATSPAIIMVCLVLIGIALLFHFVSLLMYPTVLTLQGISPDKHREYKEAVVLYGEAIKERLNIKFERIAATESHIYFKIATTKHAISGAYISVLPEGVFVSDLLSKETCKDLSSLIDRRVECYNDQNGIWYSIHHAPHIEESFKPYLDVYPGKFPR